MLQTLVRLVEEEEGDVFDPEDIAAMGAAFDRLLSDFKLVDRGDPVVTRLSSLLNLFAMESVIPNGYGKRF